MAKKVDAPVEEASLLSSVFTDPGRRPIVSDEVFHDYDVRQRLYEEESDEDIKRTIYQRTNCLPFDLVTAGKGTPLGRSVLLYSGFGVGKTTLLFEVSKGLCKQGKKVLYGDVESSDDTAEQMGLMGKNLLVPEDSFKYLSIETYADAERVFYAFLESDYQFLMLDSVTMLNKSKAARLKDFEKGKTVESSGSIGEDARIQSRLIKNITSDIKGTNKCVIIIAQERMKIDIANPRNNGPKAAASNATQFAANVIINVRPSVYIKDGVRTIGRFVNLYADKNYYAQGFVKIPATIVFGQGVSNIDILFKLGIWLELFTRAKSGWYNINIPNAPEPVSVRGMPGVNEWIKDNFDTITNLFYDNAKDFLAFFADRE